MTYATLQDAIDLYGQDYINESVHRGEGDSDSAVTAFGDALAQAKSELDTYIGVRYDLPLSTVPDVLKRFCIDIAVYVSSPSAAELTEQKIERYERAIKWAEDLAKGKASLGTDDLPTSVDAEGGMVLTEPSSSTRVFTRSKMAGAL